MKSLLTETFEHARMKQQFANREVTLIFLHHYNVYFVVISNQITLKDSKSPAIK